jgi:hypothetical protein
MAKRAVDLSIDELAAMGAKAARAAAQESQHAGLTLTGSVTTYDETQPASVLAQLHPSGTVTFVRHADAVGANDQPNAADAKHDKAAG